MRSRIDALIYALSCWFPCIIRTIRTSSGGSGVRHSRIYRAFDVHQGYRSSLCTGSRDRRACVGTGQIGRQPAWAVGCSSQRMILEPTGMPRCVQQRPKGCGRRISPSSGMASTTRMSVLSIARSQSESGPRSVVRLPMTVRCACQLRRLRGVQAGRPSGCGFRRGWGRRVRARRKLSGLT